MSDINAATTNNLNSGGRNFVSTLSAFNVPLPAAAGLFVAASQVAAAVLGVPIGCNIAYDGFQKARAASRERDLEGTVYNSAWSGIGASYAGLSGVLGTVGAMVLSGHAVPPAIVPAFAYGGAAFYGALLGYAGYGLWRTSQFQSGLEQAAGEGKALAWLKNELASKKTGQLELRIGAECLAMLREKLPRIEKEEDAKEIIYEVKKACFKQKVTRITLIVIALLGIVACLAIMFLAGPVSPLLFAVGAVVWMAVDSSTLHNFIGEKCCKLFLPPYEADQKEEEHGAA